MSLFRVGGTACLRVSRLAAPVNARFVSNVKTTPADPPSTPRKESELINKETPSEAMSRHQPDYDATIDHGTSYGPSIELHVRALSLTRFIKTILSSPQAGDGRQRTRRDRPRCCSLRRSDRFAGSYCQVSLEECQSNLAMVK